MGSRIALWLIASGFIAQAGAGQPAIQYAEPVNIPLSSGVAEFDAYGRRFSLALAANDRVLQKLAVTQKVALESYRLLRGSVAGAPGSWVRLTETPEGVEGAIWDGQELYAVTRYETIAGQLTTPLNAAPGQTVVYRLSDTRDALPADFCSLDEAAGTHKVTALDQYKSMVAEMQTGAVITPSITRQLDISLIADSAFQQADGSDPTAAMLARLNIVEGIFSEQVGLLILASDIRLIAPESDPFTSTKPTTLLEQLSSYRTANSTVRSRGLAHLMTGKDLDGTTAGIAYVRTVCEKERGVSLSQRSYGTTISALVMAHELGHNFGASHDSEPGTPCASTPTGFIMASSVTGYGTFSQCSIDTMKPVLAAASCVTEAEFADVTLSPDVGLVQGEGGLPFTLPFTVRSAGNIAASGTEFTVTLPPSMSYRLDSASISQGNCTVGDFTVTCAIGDLAPDGEVRVSVTGQSRTAASITAQARVSAANDRITSNNNRQLQVSLRSGIDARLALSVSESDLAVGASFEVHADLGSLRAMAVSNATISLSLNQPVTGASVSGGACTLNANSVSCTVSEIPSGTTRRVTVQVTAQNAGPLFASASVNAPGDGDLGNNGANAGGWVQAARDVELTVPVSSLDLSVGVVHEVPYTIRSRGLLVTDGVEVLFTVPAALAIDRIDAGGASCQNPSAYVWRCALGTLSPGEARVVRLRFHATAPTSGDIAAVAVVADDGYLGNNSEDLRLRIDHLVDLGITLASGGTGLEGLPFEGQVGVGSNGRQAASGTLEITLHPAGLLKSATIHHGQQCTLLGSNRARCSLSTLARGATLYVDYTAEFDEPGDYDIHFAVSAVGDSAPANDSLTRPVRVRPYLDASVSGSLNMDGLFGGQTRVQTFTVRTGHRALAAVRFLATQSLPSLSVEAISADIGLCRVDVTLGGVCDFVDLPAYSSVPVTVTYRAAEGAWIVEPTVSVSTSGDVASGNNALTARIESLGVTDLELRVAGGVTGPRSTLLSFPTIELINGGSKAMTPRLEVTLPTGVTVAEVSASDGICSGDTTLRCDFDTLDPFARASVSLSVRGSIDGSYISNVKVIVANDTNPANDSRDVAVEISGATVAASNASGRSGGGGRMEWLALTLLALLVWHKVGGLRRRACRARRSHQ